MDSTVTKTQLENGMTVLLKEMHHAPVATFMVWYRVGSRNEVPGRTGVSHWVEHMMFKGTPSFPGTAMERMISREGGFWNAFTWLDYTAYYETMPSDRINLALELEADRMVNTLMEREEVEAERTVILSERAMYENQPNFLLGEELTSAAFRVHPYHHEVIGDTADLHSMTRDDLYQHYRLHYHPTNAIAVAVGDFDTADMLARLTSLYGPIQPGEPTKPIVRVEPEQPGERRVTVNGPGDTAYLTFAYRVPGAAHEDYPALSLLNAAFAGGSSLGMFGGGGSNRSSRLYKALVATELAAGAYGSLTPTIDPFLYSISAVARAGRTLAEVEAALEAELARLAAEPITEAELAKALKRARAQFIMAGESISGQAQLIGAAEAITGDYRWFETVLERLAQVKLEDIERVRAQYLQPHNRTVGWYQPMDDQPADVFSDDESAE
ncbi:MAG: insulinase family protein [Anaerolineales bacterium]|uniref:M16 family metallopeptidase n=1 Tax=Promineifilum sp. TaxID=2664178 RepID=UPI001D785A97|nr:insulinase family protein [Anaerolineales bacterium]MCB8936198.1 insulinase family protein [Promineifilum sp.]MCO5178658.1 insulinase family protein [Promineifilum sp.]